ncbi:MAG: hypothetical protein HC852_07845 [Acaryochloridaceae cyanobacterium RU_4_10]|nr:hypothetical protein [Acaryochloridaceae cyanobacterium RU_4_10]
MTQKQFYQNRAAIVEKRCSASIVFNPMNVDLVLQTRIAITKAKAGFADIVRQNLLSRILEVAYIASTKVMRGDRNHPFKLAPHKPALQECNLHRF